jgi:SPP1 family phage portal protein
LAYIDRAFLPAVSEQAQIIELIKAGAKTAMSNPQIIALEVKEFLASKERAMMITGEAYYRNYTDIQRKRRLMSDGTELLYRKNTKLEHAFYRKIVDQICGYMLAQPASIMPVEKDDAYSEQLNYVLNQAFWKTFTRAARSAVNQAITWLTPYIDGTGALKFMFLNGYEIIPFWRDSAHTELDAVIRFYDVIEYEGTERKTVTKAEFWTTEGVSYYIIEGAGILLDVQMTEERGSGHFKIGDAPYNWTRVPFIPVKYNDIEQPLIEVLKTNIDTYNYQASVHADILADIPAALVAVKGYGGEPDRILHDIFQSRIAMLHHDGDIKVLLTEPQTESVETMLTRIRRDIFSFGAGVDGQDEGADNRSGEAQKHKRADLDTICNLFEIELQEAMQQAIWFVDNYLLMIGAGDFIDSAVSVTFNRDIIVNESAAITDAKNSVGIISQRTIVANHPWVEDVDLEIQQLEDEQAKDQEMFEQKAAAGGNRGGALDGAEQ